MTNDSAKHNSMKEKKIPDYARENYARDAMRMYRRRWADAEGWPAGRRLGIHHLRRGKFIRLDEEPLHRKSDGKVTNVQRWVARLRLDGKLVTVSRSVARWGMRGAYLDVVDNFAKLLFKAYPIKFANEKLKELRASAPEPDDTDRRRALVGLRDIPKGKI
jgi:hypothetical protein